MTYEVPRDELLATVMIEPGLYLLGDPCYAIPDRLWMEWLEAAHYETEHVLDAKVRGHRAIAFSTLYGDGCYEGSDGGLYGVDAGLIGLVPMALLDDVDANPNVTLGKKFGYEESRFVPEGVEPSDWDGDLQTMISRIIRIGTDGGPRVACTYERGLMKFGPVTIDTRD